MQNIPFHRIGIFSANQCPIVMLKIHLFTNPANLYCMCRLPLSALQMIKDTGECHMRNGARMMVTFIVTGSDFLKPVGIFHPAFPCGIAAVSMLMPYRFITCSARHGIPCMGMIDRHCITASARGFTPYMDMIHRPAITASSASGVPRMAMIDRLAIAASSCRIPGMDMIHRPAVTASPGRCVPCMGMVYGFFIAVSARRGIPGMDMILLFPITASPFRFIPRMPMVNRICITGSARSRISFMDMEDILCIAAGSLFCIPDMPMIKFFPDDGFHAFCPSVIPVRPVLPYARFFRASLSYALSFCPCLCRHGKDYCQKPYSHLPQKTCSLSDSHILLTS